MFLLNTLCINNRQNSDTYFVILVHADQQLTTEEKFAHMMLSDPTTHSLYNDLTKCRPYIATQSAFRSTPSIIDIYEDSTFSYSARILTKRNRVSTDCRATYYKCLNCPFAESYLVTTLYRT